MCSWSAYTVIQQVIDSLNFDDVFMQQGLEAMLAAAGNIHKQSVEQDGREFLEIQCSARQSSSEGAGAPSHGSHPGSPKTAPQAGANGTTKTTPEDDLVVSYIDRSKEWLCLCCNKVKLSSCKRCSIHAKFMRIRL